MTDTHLWGKNPGSRIDIYNKAILNKIIWIGKFAKKYNIQTIIHAGDVFHSPDISNNLLSELIQILRFEYQGCNIYTVPGNHDIFGNNMNTISKTAIGILFASGCMLNLDHQIVEIPFSDKNKVILTGSGSSLNYDENIDNYIAPWSWEYKNAGDILINVSHGSLFSKKAKIDDGWTKTYVNDILLQKENKTDILISGHIHAGFDIVFKNNKYFLNPGALARLTTSNSDINLQVKIAIIEISDVGEINIEYIQLPPEVALPADQVLDIERLREEKAAQQNLTKFIYNVGTVSKSIDIDPHKTLDVIIKSEHVGQDTIDMVNYQLEKAHHEISEEEE